MNIPLECNEILENIYVLIIYTRYVLRLMKHLLVNLRFCRMDPHTNIWWVVFWIISTPLEGGCS